MVIPNRPPFQKLAIILLYQPVYSLEGKGDCDAIHRYESEVLPSAEKAKFEKPRSKFLFLAYRGIGNCLMKQQHFPGAALPEGDGIPSERIADARKTADLAYEQATRPNVPAQFLKEVVKIGRLIAQASNGESAIAKWSARTLGE